MKMFRYVIEAKSTQVIRIPSTRIMSVITKRDDLVIYALVDIRDQQLIPYEVRVFGTKHDIDVDDYNFLGTAKTNDDRLVYHVFYRRIENED